MSNAVLAYATYLPDWRVDVAGRGKATRIAASFDEDAITLGVSAARALTLSVSETEVASLAFVTSTPPYLDKTNATAVHAALMLDRTAPAHDVIGTARSLMATIRAAQVGRGALVVAGDVRTGRVGSADERSGADAGAAVMIGPPTPTNPALAEFVAEISLTEEFLDRWRDPMSRFGSAWEERFGFERYAPMISDAAAGVLRDADIAVPDHVVITCANTAVAKKAGALVQGSVSSGGSPIGYAGAVDPLVGLAHVLDRAAEGETILWISAADGVDAILLRTTGELPGHRQSDTVASSVGGGQQVSYPTYLSWRGLVDVEPPRRPAPERPAAPPSARAGGWKFGFCGSRCTQCRFVHLPPMRVCRRCGAADQFDTVQMSTRKGRIATYTVDRLAYSPSPPVVDVVVDFDGGGRTTLEVADAVPDLLEVGAEVEVSFRRLFTAEGVHNYFWKARQMNIRSSKERS